MELAVLGGEDCPQLGRQGGRQAIEHGSQHALQIIAAQHSPRKLIEEEQALELGLLSLLGLHCLRQVPPEGGQRNRSAVEVAQQEIVPAYNATLPIAGDDIGHPVS